MMDEDSSCPSSSSPFQELPPHLLHKILRRSNLLAADLAHVEACCYAFRAPHGFLPLRFKSVPEIAALDLCRAHPIFSAMPARQQARLLWRCLGSWKLLLRFLQSTEQAHGSVQTPNGKIQVAAGKYHTLLCFGGNKLYFCGHNHPVLSEHQSDGSGIQRRFLPMHLPLGVSIAQVASSHLHTAFVTKSGELFTFGDNSSGCCGTGENEQTLTKPVLVEALTGIPCKQAATGFKFTVVLTSSGHVYTCGVNLFGQLGHGDVVERHIPTKISSPSDLPLFVEVSAGNNHSLAVTQDGAVYSWGYGSNLSLGHGEVSAEFQPRLIREFQNRECYILHVAAGDEHSVAVDANGQVYTWGKGYCGALGQGDEMDRSIPELVEHIKHVRAIQVCAKKRKTFVLSDTGDVYAFGWMSFGSLGVSGKGNSDKIFRPTVVEALSSYHIAQVSTGLYHTMFITNKGIALGCGDNERGQLGVGNIMSCPLPVEIDVTEVIV